jgi:hypothetical protein
MAHDEFPPLTRSGIEVLQHANTANYENHVGPGGIRPFAAAVICEAVKQAAPFYFGTMQVVAVGDLLQIAQNLHDPLPPPPHPPTREQMDTALQDLLADPYRGNEWLYDRLAILQRGIAYHCKVQP